MESPAPGDGNGFEVTKRVVVADLAALLAQCNLAELRLDRRRAIGGTCGGLERSQRILIAAKRFGETPAQQSDRRRLLGTHADDVEIVATHRRARIVPHLQRRTERIRNHDPLHIQRQRRDRELDILELLARLRPFFLPRQSERLPELGIDVRRHDGIGEIRHRKRRTARQCAGDRVNDQRRRVFLPRLGFCKGQIENTLRFGIHPARKIEPRQIDMDGQARHSGGQRRLGQQFVARRG